MFGRINRRGYSGEGETTHMYPLVYATGDRVAYALAALLVAGAIASRMLL